MKYVVALTIAGSDPCGGAGIQADMKTMSALGVYACSAITALTVQDTKGVYDVLPVDSSTVWRQIKVVLNDLRPAAIKIGMLNDSPTASAVADALADYEGDIVLDPVMVSTSGKRLLDDDALQVVRKRLTPLCTVITPNIPEAEVLSGIKINGPEECEAAAREIMKLGCKAVLIKGGHAGTDYKKDFLAASDGTRQWFSMPTVNTRNTHGTGCTLSSAICSYLAMGHGLTESVALAKRFVHEALAAGAAVEAGRGAGPMCHMFDPQPAIKL